MSRYLSFEPLNEAAMQAVDSRPSPTTAQDKALIERMESRINAAMESADQQYQDDLMRSLFWPESSPPP